MPGLTGQSSSYYVQHAARHIVTAWPGARVAAYNPRGRGGNALEQPFLYSAGFTEDLRYVLEHIAGEHIAGSDAQAKPPIYVVAFSLGANVVCKMLGEDGDASLVDGACLCSPPIDLLSMSNYLENTWQGKLFDQILVRGCNKLFEQEPLLRDKMWSLGSGRNDQTRRRRRRMPQSMLELDDRLIAPMFGFSCASEYYRGASCGPYLSRVRRPTLFVHARNDPIVAGNLIRRDDFESGEAEHIVSVMTKEGGHSMDLNEGFGMAPWFPRLATEFLMQLDKRNKADAEAEAEGWPPYCCAILQDPSTGGFLLEQRPPSARVAPDQLTCFGGKRDLVRAEAPEACLARELREELGWAPATAPTRAVDLYVDGELIAWFFLAAAPPRDAALSFETERGYSGVWWEPAQNAIEPPRLSPWHACVLAAFRSGEHRADFVSPQVKV